MSDPALPASIPAAQLPAPAGLPSLPVEIRACWNEVGVSGQGTCPELSQFVHCRNCPVYSAASLQLLNRPLAPAYRREWTEYFAAEKVSRKPASTSAVFFRIGTEWLGLPTQVFQEVAEHRAIHSLPHRRPGPVLGLANIRGELVVCVSLGHFLGLERLARPEVLRAAYRRLLVVNWDTTRLAFPVDEVQGPHRIQPPQLKAPPATLAKSSLTYTHGVFYWQQRAVGLLDVGLLFSTLNRSLR